MTRKEYQHQYYQARSKWLRDRNLCVYCKKQDERTLQGFCNCKECAEKARKRAMRRLMKMKGADNE